MDIVATLVTGIIWGLIINVCWISGYLLVLLYHFSKEDDPLYMSDYERYKQLIHEGKTGQAAKESFYQYWKRR